MLASDVVLTNSAGIHAVPIAEYVVGSVLYFLRGLDMVVEQQRGVVWDKQRFVGDGSPLREMDTVRALVVGVGGIGGAVGKRLSALGAQCTGVRRRVSLGPPEGFARVIALDDIDAALPEHDVIVLAAPLTAATRELLTAARLDRLPRRAIVVNVARGAMIDEAAIAERLADGRLRGAALDVFEHEPLAATSPLWQLRSVLLSPHVSPVSPGRFWPRQLDLFLDNWSRYLAGQPMKHVVNKQAGY
jgi:phosphoglycerate dehydrogenase-like enzyme